MVKIDWSKESGFMLADPGNFEKPLIRIEECLIGGILNGFIEKGQNGAFLISIYTMCCREIVQAEEPGFDGFIKALNSQDWSKLAKVFHDFHDIHICCILYFHP